MKHHTKSFVVGCLLAFIANPAVAGWERQVGGWLSGIPLLDIVAQRIVSNRIAFVEAASTRQPAAPTKQRTILARVRLDLGARANIRNVPRTSGGSKVIAQLYPGDYVRVISAVEGAPWLKVAIKGRRLGFIHRNLVTISR